MLSLAADIFVDGVNFKWIITKYTLIWDIHNLISIGMDVYFTQNSAILICSEGELLIHHSQKDSTRDFDGFSNFPNLGFKV